MREELIQKIDDLFKKNPDLYRQRSGDDAVLEKFYGQFPLDRLPSLTLEDYCLGTGCRPENFSWWIERGLQKALGRYMPENGVRKRGQRKQGQGTNSQFEKESLL